MYRSALFQFKDFCNGRRNFFLVMRYKDEGEIHYITQCINDLFEMFFLLHVQALAGFIKDEQGRFFH